MVYLQKIFYDCFCRHSFNFKTVCNILIILEWVFTAGLYLNDYFYYIEYPTKVFHFPEQVTIYLFVFIEKNNSIMI